MYSYIRRTLSQLHCAYDTLPFEITWYRVHAHRCITGCEHLLISCLTSGLVVDCVGIYPIKLGQQKRGVQNYKKILVRHLEISCGLGIC